ncbi:YciI family protein [Clostridioides difficile]|nr:GTP cyclohydrolase [Clostridioides difficile]
MFIFNLTYIKPTEEVDKVLSEHVKYLDKYYSLCKFICSGRKSPRTGGVIICNASDKSEVKKIIQEDPFYTLEIAKYDVIEFTPTKYDSKFKYFI